MNLHEFLKTKYLEYVNDYLTVKVWALANNLSEEQGRALLAIARELHEQDSAPCAQTISSAQLSVSNKSKSTHLSAQSYPIQL